MLHLNLTCCKYTPKQMFSLVPFYLRDCHGFLEAEINLLEAEELAMSNEQCRLAYTCKTELLARWWGLPRKKVVGAHIPICNK